MTEKIFYQDGYRKTHSSTVERVVDNGVVFESTIFYALGGGQPGDTGNVSIGDKTYKIIDTRFDEDRVGIVHFLQAEELSGIQPGEKADMELDWHRRHRLMRMHTSMHLMCHLIPAQATGGSIGETDSRIDFDLQGLEVDKEDLTRRMNALIQNDLAVSVGSISEEELDQNPGLVRTMSVQPPRGQGTVRTINIENIDYQPCGGTHVKSTGEIGEVIITKLKNKGKQNKRISLALVNP